MQEIVRRHLPPAVRVLDVGGATGVHSEWLLDDGHTVHLVDLLPGHVARADARLGGHERFTASVGDARALPVPDASVDAVLLLGPLYHLTDRADRLATWREALRVVVPGGVVIAMAINRFASLFDGLAQSYLFDPAFRAIVAQDLATGVHENPTGDPRWFTTAYFHRPEELAAEATEAGLVVRETVGVEGLAHWIKSLASAFDDDGPPRGRARRGPRDRGGTQPARPQLAPADRGGPPRRLTQVSKTFADGCLTVSGLCRRRAVLTDGQQSGHRRSRARPEGAPVSRIRSMVVALSVAALTAVAVVVQAPAQAAPFVGRRRGRGRRLRGADAARRGRRCRPTPSCPTRSRS